MTNYDPTQASYSEIHESRFIVRVERVGDADGTANVGYWDSIQGGQISRTITPRKRPGMTDIGKVPAMHKQVGTVTISRAWNRNVEDRKSIHALVADWANGNTKHLEVKITQMVFDEETGKYEDYEFFQGPVQSYEGPKGNSEGENFVKEQLVIDPSKHGYLGANATGTATTSGG